ncbi:MAG: D-sedoheptulose-7-phosphate isomerase [Endomicrobiales bacterium]
MKEKIRTLIKESIDAKEKLLAPESVDVLAHIAESMLTAYRARGKVLVFGNGGSAADAQHLAAELVVRFEKNRRALPALALSTDTSVLSACGNDFGFEDVFSRQVEAFARPGDVVIGISTSGTSPNVCKALEKARALKAVTVAFTGETGGKLKGQADLCFCAPSKVTARVQECHGLAIHVLCRLVEEALFEAQ